jgi:enoyl-CoA hydratase/carnithine racemase
MAAALDMLMSGRWLDAGEALRMKLVNRVVPRDRLLPEVNKVAARIRSNSLPAVRYIKQAVTRGLDLSLQEGLDLESRLGRRLNSMTEGNNSIERP